MTDQASKLSVYYDGSCNLCNASVASLKGSSKYKRFTMTDITTGSLPPGITSQEAFRDVHVIDNGEILKGLEGVFRILEEYPGWRIVARIGKLPIIRGIARAVYRFIATYRYRIFGKKDVL